MWSCRADLASPWRNVAALAPNRPDEVMAKGTNTRLPSADTPMLGEAPEARRLGVLSAELRMLAERSPVALASHRWTPGARSLRCSAATSRSWTGVSLRCATGFSSAQIWDLDPKSVIWDQIPAKGTKIEQGPKLGSSQF